MEDIIKTLKQLEKTQNRTVKIPPNPTTQDKARVSVLVNILQTSLSLGVNAHTIYRNNPTCMEQAEQDGW